MLVYIIIIIFIFSIKCSIQSINRVQNKMFVLQNKMFVLQNKIFVLQNKIFVLQNKIFVLQNIFVLTV